MAETDDNEMGEKPDVRNFRDRFFQDFFGIAEASRGVLHHVPPDKLVEQALWNEMECGDQLEETVKSVTEPELEKKTMNAIEQWELRGEIRGEKRGEKRNQIKVVQNMLSEGLEADAICRIAGVDADFVGKVQSGELTTENSAAKKGS